MGHRAARPRFGLFLCRADPGTAQSPVPGHMGRRAEMESTAQHDVRAVLARLFNSRVGPGFVLTNPCRARAGPMDTAQTCRTSSDDLLLDPSDRRVQFGGGRGRPSAARRRPPSNDVAGAGQTPSATAGPPGRGTHAWPCDGRVGRRHGTPARAAAASTLT